MKPETAMRISGKNKFHTSLHKHHLCAQYLNQLTILNSNVDLLTVQDNGGRLSIFNEDLEIDTARPEEFMVSDYIEVNPLILNHLTQTLSGMGLQSVRLPNN